MSTSAIASHIRKTPWKKTPVTAGENLVERIFFFCLEFFLKEKDKDKIMTLIQVYKRRHGTDFI